MEIDKKLHDDIKTYCKLNGLKMNEYINKLLRMAFNIDKYGITPFSQHQIEVEKPVINDIINEAPAEHEQKGENVVGFTTVVDNGNIEEIKIVEIKNKKRKLK